jgi:hypothetical protein
MRLQLVDMWNGARVYARVGTARIAAVDHNLWPLLLPLLLLFTALAFLLRFLLALKVEVGRRVISSSKLETEQPAGNAAQQHRACR